MRTRLSLIAFGLALSPLVIEAALRGGAFVYRLRQRLENAAVAEKSSDYRILCLGESTTAPDGADDYPAQLQDILNAAGSDRRFAVINRGAPGLTTNSILGGLEEDVRRYRPRCIIAMMGINDPTGVPGSSGGADEPHLRSLRLLRALWKERRFILQGAELAYLRARTRLAPRDPDLNLRYGWASYHVGRYENALAAFEAAAAADPGSLSAIEGAGRSNYRLGRWSRFLFYLDKAALLDSPDIERYHFFIGMGIANRRLKQAQAMLGRLFHADPGSPFGMLYSGDIAIDRGRYAEAAAFYRKTLARKPDDLEACWGLSRALRRSRLWSEAETATRGCLKLLPLNEDLRYQLAQTYLDTGRRREADEVFRELRALHVKPMTTSNYLRLWRLCRALGVKLVAVQYPIRDVALLRATLPPDAEALIVDNGPLFRDALRRYGYAAIFKDEFADDFGHATRLGNRILAENVAAALLADLRKSRP